MSVGSKSLPARRSNEGHENGDGAVAREEGDLGTGGGSKSLPARRGNEGHENGDMATGGGGSVGSSSSRSRSRKQKAARYNRCFSGLELSIGPGPLKEVDAGRLKGQIKKWAKAVVAFARQISFGSPRSVPTPRGGGDDTPRSAPLLASRSSSHFGARGTKEGASDVNVNVRA